MPSAEIKSTVDMSFWDRLAERCYRLDHLEVEAGYITPRMHEGSELTTGDIAAIHCQGSIKRNIPPRDFMVVGAVYWLQAGMIFSKAFTDYALKRKSENESFTSVGRLGMRSIQKAIMSQQFVALKPETVRKKGSSTILYETGQLINGVEWRVGMK